MLPSNSTSCFFQKSRICESYLENLRLFISTDYSFYLSPSSRVSRTFIFVREIINLHLKHGKLGIKSSTNYNQWLHVYAEGCAHTKELRGVMHLFHSSLCFHQNCGNFYSFLLYFISHHFLASFYMLGFSIVSISNFLIIHCSLLPLLWLSFVVLFFLLWEKPLD